jgi:hypothetical protein
MPGHGCVRCSSVNNAAFTDTVLRTMAQHCPQLLYVDLSASVRVTEAAVLDAQKLVPRCLFPTLTNFIYVARRRVRSAREAGRASAT